jgi:hypothetical protein
LLWAVIGALAIAVLGLSHTLLKHPPYAPAVNSEQHSDSRLKAHQGDDAKRGATNDAPPGIPAIGGEGGCGKCQPKAEHGEEEGTEFWPPFYGYRLKITDTLVAAFTALLFFATVALWLSTRNLVRGADKTSKQQLRAYLLPDKAIVPRTDLVPTTIEINIKNFGQTPAYNVTSWLRTELVAADQVETDELFLFQETTKASIDVGPGGFLRLHRPVSVTLVDELIEGKVLVAWGSIKYRDIFRRCQFTTFRLQSRWPMGPNGIEMIGAGRGNSASDPASEEETGGPYSKAAYPREGEIWRKD